VNKNQPDINQTSLLAGIIGQVGCITIIIVGLALGAGLLLDRFLGTEPIFTILLMVGSVPVTLYIIVRVSLLAAARIQQTQETTTKQTEDKAGE
jgi:F0F1-type ATP synthase assembly protein I